MKYIKLIVFFTYCVFSLCGQTKQERTYAGIIAGTEKKREEFQIQYQSANGDTIRQSIIINQARQFLKDNINSYFEAWYNTPWDFNGTTRTPGKGRIACGYLVTTILADMGFPIPRIKWAQLPSETMIRNMTTDVKRFHSKPVKDIEKYIESKGEGVYVVGLDCHVGFIYNHNDEISFIHSSYYEPEIGVMKQKLSDSSPLSHSSYRVVGKIFTDKMIKRWLLN